MDQKESRTNCTSATAFILLGFIDLAKFQSLIFLGFLVMYLVTVLGNTGIIGVIRKSPCLHTPMYFFISHLSFLDLCYSTVIAPKTLVNLVKEDKTITVLGCALQMFIFITLCTTECLLLGAMAYDRYVAICSPLLYPVIMSKRFCIQLVAAAYIVGSLQSLLQTGCTFRLSYCGSHSINHFYCDIPPLLKISSTDTFVNEMVLFICGSVTDMSSITIILVSYTYILSTILRIRSAEGRRKAFSTCASHLTAVTLFYGTIFFMYLRPPSSYSQTQDRAVSVVYTQVIPMLNPLIYSLRNKDVKSALRKVISVKSIP
ncbi:olfactory receptor 1020-like [Microcaecilia unicolor]|uniref:Olfactory receptor n=1 Tax=Microcaecilia unicolor TaxID=1415580 RepID=A0A6P7X0Y9_9AMPH|nr:olfactory receptor 1020-like [Microcaecilia unicolor]XP_030046148.1 olfactory receptor 1020-like [Microcaecilia unicolor]